MERVKYTYDDWWEGRICPTYNNVEGDHLIKWYDIIEEDLPKIHQKQKELFEIEVEILMLSLKEFFLEKKGKSKEPAFLYRNWLEECTSLLFGNVPSEELVITGYLHIPIEKSHLIMMREYIKNVYEDGRGLDYYFIHSINCYILNKDLPEVEAEGLYRFYKWLSNDNTSNHDQNKDVNNWHQNIFKDINAYNTFKALDEALITKATISKHAFIFYVLSVNNMLQQIKQISYIYFLKKELGLVTRASKMTTRYPEYLKVILNEKFPHLAKGKHMLKLKIK